MVHLAGRKFNLNKKRKTVEIAHFFPNAHALNNSEQGASQEKEEAEEEKQMENMNFREK